MGLIILILGSFIMIFDYPQIEYFNYLQNENSITLEQDKKEIFQKILIEFTIGVILLIIGIVLILISMLKKFENRFRQ